MITAFLMEEDFGLFGKNSFIYVSKSIVRPYVKIKIAIIDIWFLFIYKTF